MNWYSCAQKNMDKLVLVCDGPQKNSDDLICVAPKNIDP
jgi:hypothetical protein